MNKEEKDRLWQIANRFSMITDILSKDIVHAFERGADSEGCFMLGELHRDLREIHTELLFFDDDE